MAALDTKQTKDTKQIMNLVKLLNAPLITREVVNYVSTITITNTNINISNPTENYNLNYGNEKNTIIINDITTGKGKKQKKMKEISIYKKIIFCPISNMPYLIGEKVYNLTSGFAFNKNIIKLCQHKKYNLSECLYFPFLLSRERKYDIIRFHLCFKINHNCELHPEVAEILEKLLNYDLMKYIGEFYKVINSKVEPMFSMVQNDLLIDTKQSFTKQGLKNLFEKGLLEIGISIISGLELFDDNIYMLNYASYDHVFPNGNKSNLTKILQHRELIDIYRKYFIDVFFR
jgi:hypothetical protein